MTLLAVRFIDIAMAFSMGGLWLFGAGFIYVLYRWIIRFETQEGDTDVDRPSGATVHTTARPAPRVSKPRVHPAAARSFTPEDASPAAAIR